MSGIRTAGRTFRRTPLMANTDEIAKSWRPEVISSLPWQRASNQGDVGAGDLRGFPVVASGFPGRGFLKPGIAIVDSPRKSYAAREKIAADLAHDLSLPVPPAVLWRRNEHWEEVESRVVISLYLYLESSDWALVEYAGKRPLNLDEGEARVLLAATSGMLAFDTSVPGQPRLGLQSPDSRFEDRVPRLRERARRRWFLE